jgi:CHAD domain-containing protein
MPPEAVKLRDIKPVLTGNIRDARAMLDPAVIPSDTVVHDVRVLMKKSRASVRLLKTQIDEAAFDREYSDFREVGRIMRSWRESSVHRKVLKSLKKKYPDLFRDLASSERISAFLNNDLPGSGMTPELKSDIEKIIGILVKSDYRWRFRSLNNLNPHLLLGQLEFTYRSVAGCYMTSRNYPKQSNIHEFRKRSKDLLYQLYFFRSLNPKLIKALEKRLDLLAQNLGRYNDFAVLIDSLGYKFQGPGNTGPLDELILIIRQEQDKCLSRIWPDAFRLFRPGESLMNLLGFRVLTF